MSMNWQPIETAPKDGTRVLLALSDRDEDERGKDFYGSGVVIGFWDEHYQNGEGWLIDREEQFAGWCDPTDWQPVPDMPAPRL
jgi:hypothetical protein